MTDLTESVEENRGRLRSIAHRMLGSPSEADDALQEAWLRISDTDGDGVDNPAAWLTTVVSRVCLNMLRSRKARGEREEAGLDRLPDPVVLSDEATDPEHEALMSDAVGIALSVVLDTLPPAERPAFVLHDMFAVPFEDIATIVDRSPQAARQLASRARRRVQGTDPSSETDPARRRSVVAAFRAAARQGDFEALLTVLDPDVVLRVDAAASPVRVVSGAAAVAGQAVEYRMGGPASTVVPALVNDGSGLVIFRDGVPYSVMGFTVAEDRITGIDILSDRDRLDRLDLPNPG